VWWRIESRAASRSWWGVGAALTATTPARQGAVAGSAVARRERLAQVNDEREARRPKARRGLPGTLDNWPGMQNRAWTRGRSALARSAVWARRPLGRRATGAPRSRLGPQRRGLGPPYAGPGSGRHVDARPRTRAHAGAAARRRRPVLFRFTCFRNCLTSKIVN
jgi:hypothetical protein